MFVGDHGRVFSIKRFKGLVYLWFFFLAAAVFTSLGLYYLYQETNRKNQKLSLYLENTRKQFIAMRRDKDILMARLVVAESRLERLEAEMRAEKTDAGERENPEGNETTAVDSDEKKETENTKPTLPAEMTTDLKASVDQPDSAEPVRQGNTSEMPASVSVENLKIVYETSTQTIRAQFKLSNIDDNSDPISGYTAVVLKNDDQGPDSWITMPRLQLKSGKPDGRKKGQYFSIYRFKTVRFKVSSRANPEKYRSATVFVFDSNKELLYEKSFPVDIEHVSVVADER